MKARKLGGKEGFLIGFGLANERGRARWNLGGLANTGYGLEFDGLPDAGVPGSIEIKGATVKCRLDGKLIHEVVQKKKRGALRGCRHRPKDRRNHRQSRQCLESKAGALLAEARLPTPSADWEKASAVLTPTSRTTCFSATLDSTGLFLPIGAFLGGQTHP